jgi:hypothetical protein
MVIHRCAETEVLRGNRERAVAGLAEAVAAGWRDYYPAHQRPVLGGPFSLSERALTRDVSANLPSKI